MNTPMFNVRSIAPGDIPQGRAEIGKYADIFRAIEQMATGAALEVSPLTNSEQTYLRNQINIRFEGVTNNVRKTGDDQYTLYISK